jgi:hypothetical protein
MALSISDLKNKKSADLANLQSELEKLSNQKEKEYIGDQRYWRATQDKSGNASALIRFLPAPIGENAPFVKYFEHVFSGPGGYYNELCLTTLGKKDPVADANTILWKTNQDDKSEERKTARERKRKLVYVSNVLVLKDAANPENDGKVFLFKYGAKIFDLIKSLISPEVDEFKESVSPSNPFDFWEGRNFVLRIKKVDGYTNYASSEWHKPTPIFPNGSDEDYQKLWEKQYSLQAIIDPSNFKTYEELERRFLKVINPANAPVNAAAKSLSSLNESSKFKDESSDDIEDEMDDTEASSEYDFLAKLRKKVDGV